MLVHQSIPFMWCFCCASDQLGVQPGAEFRAAAGAADAVGASLVLGDRPIEITLQRAWGALSWQRRLQLLADLMSARSGTAGTKVGSHFSMVVALFGAHKVAMHTIQQVMLLEQQHIGKLLPPTAQTADVKVAVKHAPGWISPHAAAGAYSGSC